MRSATKAGSRKRLHRVRGARQHVVRQAERVPDLVRDDLAQRLAHQGSSSTGSERASGLAAPVSSIKPVAVRAQVVVVPDDVALDDLARARVGRRSGPSRLRIVVGGPAHHRSGARPRRSTRGPPRASARDLATIASRKPAPFERDLPVLDALACTYEPPALGRRGVEVVHDRLDRLDQLAARVGLGVARLEPPAAAGRLFLGRLLPLEPVVRAPTP